MRDAILLVFGALLGELSWPWIKKLLTRVWPQTKSTHELPYEWVCKRPNCDFAVSANNAGTLSTFIEIHQQFHN